MIRSLIEWDLKYTEKWINLGILRLERYLELNAAFEVWCSHHQTPAQVGESEGPFLPPAGPHTFSDDDERIRNTSEAR